MAQKGHPKGLYLLFVTEMAERFSYYGMRALFVLYLVAAFFNSADASQIYGSYTGLVYLTPLLGGYIADRYWGNRRSIIVGGIVMAIGQFLMFASACVVQQSIFSDPATGGVISESVNNGLAMTPEQQQQMGMMKWMTYLMPIIFFFSFNSYSAGLNWYYFISGLVSILMMWFLRKTTDDTKLLEKLEKRHAERKANAGEKKKASSIMERLQAMQEKQMEILKQQQERNNK